MQLRRHTRGFTLIELLVVLVILGIVGGIAVAKFSGQEDKARVKAATASIGVLEDSIERFKIDMGRYPTEDEGLSILVSAPEGDDADAWAGPYLRKKSYLKDPWKNDFVFHVPSRDGKQPFEIISLGSDGAEGGENYAKDISNIEEDE